MAMGILKKKTDTRSARTTVMVPARYPFMRRTVNATKKNRMGSDAISDESQMLPAGSYIWCQGCKGRLLCCGD
jgi:hypothetical protein